MNFLFRLTTKKHKIAQLQAWWAFFLIFVCVSPVQIENDLEIHKKDKYLYKIVCYA